MTDVSRNEDNRTWASAAHSEPLVESWDDSGRAHGPRPTVIEHTTRARVGLVHLQPKAALEASADIPVPLLRIRPDSGRVDSGLTRSTIERRGQRQLGIQSRLLVQSGHSDATPAG